MKHQAIVTGASRGIGKAIALALARDGHRLVLNYLSRDQQAEAVASEIRDEGGECQLLKFDVSDAENASSTVKDFIKHHGPIDIVVNNAGVTRDMLFPAMKFESFRKVIDTTLTGFYAVTRPCILGMLKQNWGRIINISSMAALAPNPGQVNYSAAKAGLIGATRSLSAELCSRGILVNSLAPGFIDTDMFRATKVDQQELLKLIPQGRLGTPEEVAEVAVFLVSDRASYLTGQVIGINGGML